ncbi:uncharacterized protein [Choristoneura fumiferana]|uniref:uncharacterized protein n=1 Tax=Choristoneura fumiferana TaxID=7141 RepID=UPI003D159E68
MFMGSLTSTHQSAVTSSQSAGTSVEDYGLHATRLEEVLERFWKVEEPPSKPAVHPDHMECERFHGVSHYRAPFHTHCTVSATPRSWDTRRASIYGRWMRQDMSRNQGGSSRGGFSIDDRGIHRVVHQVCQPTRAAFTRPIGSRYQFCWL